MESENGAADMPAAAPAITVNEAFDVIEKAIERTLPTVHNGVDEFALGRLIGTCGDGREILNGGTCVAPAGQF